MLGKRSLSILVAALALVGAIQVVSMAQTGVLTVLDDKVKIGGTATSPLAPIEIIGTPGTVGVGNSVALLKNTGDLAFQLDNTSNAGFWNFASAVNEAEFRISRSGTGQVEMTLTSAGNLTITGALTTAGNTYPDYVFEDDYPLMDLSDLREFVTTNSHLPNIPPASELKERVNVNDLQRRMLEKIEELTLYTLEQQEAIEELQARLDAKEAPAPAKK